MQGARKRGLRGRAILACTLLLLTTVLTLSTALIWQSYRDSREDDVTDSIVIARFMAYSAEPYLLAKDRSALNSVLMAAATNPDVVHAAVINRNALVEASFQRDGAELEMPIDPRHPMAGETGQAGSTIMRGRKQLRIVVPIWSGTGRLGTIAAEGKPEQRLIGFLSLTTGLDHLNRELHARVMSVICIAACVLIGGVAATILVVRQFVKPLRHLVETARGIADGDLALRADEMQSAELDALAGSFNRMADVLQNHTLNLEAQVRERTAALEASEAEARKLALVASKTNNGVIITDAEGRIEWVNDGFTRLTGCRPEDVLGQTPDMLLSDQETGPEQVRRLMENLKGGSGFAIEAVQYARSGARHWVAIGGQPVHDREGRLTHFVIIQTDISQRKQAEVQMQQARDAAEAANRAKSEFLANMSHEIRTPMNGILGMTQLALETQLNTEQREYLQIVKNSAESLLAIINDLLDFSKIEAGRLDLDPIGFALRDTVVDAAKAQAVLAHSKGVELVCDIQNDVPDSLIGDVTRVRQVLINLLGNAVKFTSEGEILVRVAVENRTSDQVTLRFSVRDTGIGIPKDKQKIIFDAFAQADGSTTRRYGGTGLGLAIARRLVTLMGGEIWVESEEGTGSTFHCTSVFGIDASGAARRAPLSQDALRDLSVLVVDDNSTNRRVLVEMLSNWGMRPEHACGAAQALAKLEAAAGSGRAYRLALIDAMMPEVDGFTLAERIRENPATASTTVLMLSSAAQPGDAARCRNLGMAAYLTKPIKQSELLDSILLALGGEERAPAPPKAAHDAAPQRRPLRVLLAEDNLVNQKLAVRVLEKQGHEVVVVDHGRAALEAYRRQQPPFDVILMDVQMPVMGGFEATAAIRADERCTGTHTPIVAMTANAMKGDRERCLAAGMDEYVPKPLNLERLSDVLARVTAPADNQRVAGTTERQINLELALRRLDGDQELLSEVLATFKAHLPLMAAELRSAADTHDMGALQQAAHSLKGAAAAVSAEPARRLAEQLETSCRDNDFERADTLLHQLDGRLEMLSKTLGGIR